MHPAFIRTCQALERRIMIMGKPFSPHMTCSLSRFSSEVKDVHSYYWSGWSHGRLGSAAAALADADIAATCDIGTAANLLCDTGLRDWTLRSFLCAVSLNLFPQQFCVGIC